MKRAIVVLSILLLLFSMSLVSAQISRQAQFEVFGGVAIPMAPDEFKDYYKMGFSPHIQYVTFPSPTIGISFGAAYEYFTFDDKQFLQDFFGEESIPGLEIDGSASIIELSVGVRPYITPQEANTQIFLFGMGTYNFFSTSIDLSYEGESETVEGDDDNAGVGFGAGLEFPAGESLNIIIQGIYRIIFTEGDNTSFLGVTAGLVF